MFSEKYKNQLVEELYDELPQLDKIQFQNRLIGQRQILNSMKIGEAVVLICMFISSITLANYMYNFKYLYSLGIYSSTHVSAIGNTFIVFSLFMILAMALIFLKMGKMNKFKRENGEYLDSVLGE